MSKIIAELLGKSETEIARIVDRLEQLSGFNSEDVRLLAEMKQSARQKLHDLKLDPDDSDGAEVYHALRSKLLRDNDQFSRIFDSERRRSADKFNEALVNIFEHTLFPKEVFAMKHSVAKELLRKDPPKKLMKHMGYRSVESMLKRERVEEIYAAVPFLESERWLSKFWRNHLALSPSDFENRKINLIIMPESRWAIIAPSSGIITCMLQLGAAAVWPAPRSVTKFGFSTAALLYEAAEIMRIYSAALKIEQVRPNFGKKALELMQPKIKAPVMIETVPINWDVLHSHYGRQDEVHASMENLHVLDMHRHSPAELLATINPAFSWWAGTNSLAISNKGKIVSLNLNDVLINALNNIEYKNQVNKNFRKYFYNDLISRYLKHDNVEAYISSQLDNLTPEHETINISFNKYAKATSAELI